MMILTSPTLSMGVASFSTLRGQRGGWVGGWVEKVQEDIDGGKGIISITAMKGVDQVECWGFPRLPPKVGGPGMSTRDIIEAYISISESLL